MEIRFEEIKTLLPQQFPFLMVDRVIALEKGRSIVAIKNITGNEIFLPGHFPQFSVMPGALIMESMAQTAIILFRKSFPQHEANEESGDVFFLGGAKVRFLKTVVPGDQLHVKVTLIKAVSSGGMVAADATVDGQTVAKGDLTFGKKKLRDLNGN